MFLVILFILFLWMIGIYCLYFFFEVMVIVEIYKIVNNMVKIFEFKIK